MTVQETLEKIREGLTGEYGVDMAYLEGQAAKYSSDEQAEEIVSGITEIAYEILPEDRKEIVSKMMYMDGKRLDFVLADALQLIQEQKFEEAFKVTEALYTKVRTSFRETEELQYVSFRNELEHQLYLYFYQPTKRLERPPFDLSHMVMLHGFSLLEARKPEDAVAVLEDSIRYNPMNTAPYFEMAECYKAMQDMDALMDCTKETLSISTRPEELSRCYCNLGFYCVEKEDYDSAISFFYEAMIFENNPAIVSELHHIHKLTGKKLAPPSRKTVNAVFEKYDLKTGPNEEVVAVITALGDDAIKNNQYDKAMSMCHTLYRLTNDKKILALVEKLNKDAIAEQENAANE